MFDDFIAWAVKMPLDLTDDESEEDLPLENASRPIISEATNKISNSIKNYLPHLEIEEVAFTAVNQLDADPAPMVHEAKIASRLNSLNWRKFDVIGLHSAIDQKRFGDAHDEIIMKGECLTRGGECVVAHLAAAINAQIHRLGKLQSKSLRELDKLKIEQERHVHHNNKFRNIRCNILHLLFCEVL
jgi:hypothetical protein